MAATYSITSPYYRTGTWGQFLDIWQGKTIPADITDALYQIDPVYNFRPDLLAHDLYGDANLWWVFAVRNPNTLTDPVFGFRSPVTIYAPTRAVVNQALGL
jgi:hypothetical protein